MQDGGGDCDHCGDDHDEYDDQKEKMTTRMKSKIKKIKIKIKNRGRPPG